MGKPNSDIIEIKLYDSEHTLYYKNKARVNNMKEMMRLKIDLKAKINLFKSDWFG